MKLKGGIGLLKLDHLALVVSDSEKSKEFYCHLFGCQEIKRMASDQIKFIYLQVDNLIIELLEYPEKSQRGAGVYDHLAFVVHDLDTTIGQLKERGMAFETDTPRITPSGRKIIFMSGPDGERIELMEG
jgi:catechol 2,3-dioxygenase-like lactoylglutathione lyase family enzyme